MRSLFRLLIVLALGTAGAAWGQTASIVRDSSFHPDDLRPFGSSLLFTACDGEARQVWSTSGNAESTIPLTLGSPGFVCPPGDFRPKFTVAGGLAFFLGAPHFLGSDLWRTDGTPGGTFQIATDLVANESMAAFQGQLFFPVRLTPSVWKSDGTPGGTVEFFRLPGVSHPAEVSGVTAVGGRLYFAARNQDFRRELWSADGAANPPVRLGTFASLQPELVAAGSAVFFVANDQVWKTHGTRESTSLLIGASRGVAGPKDLAVSQGALYFITAKAPRTWTLWHSNGTTEGTAPLLDLTLPAGVSTLHLTAAAGKTFFVAGDEDHGVELWSTDGTAAGTRIVRDISPGPLSSSPGELAAGGDLLWFAADDGRHGIELWRSDGTAAGTQLAHDIAPEALSSTPLHLTVAGGNLYFSADDGLAGRELWALPLTGPSVCQPSSTRLCLGGRYQVEASWRTAQAEGRGNAVPLTADTGMFWFFEPANVEAIVKVLDGREVNGHVWVFYGALSDVEYRITVTDTRTGLTRRYFNPQGQLASVGDTQGFGPLGAHSANPIPPISTAAPSPLPLVSERIGRAAAAPCQPGARRLCLNDNRFAVEVAWKDFQNHTGIGTAVPLTGDTGAFWFFDAANIELVVKVLDGRPANGKFWLFYGALSNVEYTLTVTDTQTGTVRTYRNPSGRFASVADTSAF